jgi:EAL domain-containing protein (putative c-di-GMP-specific phosphodiesterase class I)
MGLETVAEYVQDEPAMELLRDLGVTWAQGYLLGTPELLEEKLAIIDMAPTQMFSATFTSFK